MQPSSETFRGILENFRTQETAALLNLLKHNILKEEEIDAISHILERRQAIMPNERSGQQLRKKRTTPRNVAVESNVVLYAAEEPLKIELHFPKDGYMCCDRSTFASQQELFNYIYEVFFVPQSEGMGFNISMKRKGKYKRVNRQGKPVFTFGDPILDVITDEQGWTTIGKETFNFKALEITSGGSRSGGISLINLSSDNEAIKIMMLRDAIFGSGGYTVVENDNNSSIIASANPSEINFTDGNARMRFRAFRKRHYQIFTKIGSEIETWQSDFNSATIDSVYADPVIPSNPYICGIVKRDVDTDTNDDYVDEYEWGTDPPSTVRSYCEARWRGRDYDGSVMKGDCTIFVNE